MIRSKATLYGVLTKPTHQSTTLSVICLCLIVQLTFMCAPKAQAQQPSTSEEQPVAGEERHSPQKERFFYHGQDYGSESQFGPLNVFVNIGLGVNGRLNSSARLSDIDLSESFKHLGTAYFNPSAGIREGYGTTGVWLFMEFFPILGLSSFPNYFLHFLGEGMLSRKLEEYYESRELSPLLSKVLAIATITLTQTMNELTEACCTTPGDAFADLFMNTLGIVAFSFDSFARLFSNESVQLYYWPDQAVIDVRDSAIFNHNESYLLRTTLGDWTSWKFALVFGLSNSGLGVSIPLNEGDYLTVGTFLGGANLPRRDYVPPDKGPIFYWDTENKDFTSDVEFPSSVTTMRFYWDRRGSLMASLDVGLDGLYIGANIYPGLLKFGSVKLGGYAAYSAAEGGTGAFGLTLDVISVMPGYRF